MGYAIQEITTNGTWIPVFTGFSADPTVSEARYTKVGKIVTANLRLVNGTSNATTFTLTMPFAGGSSSQIFIILITNNGSQAAGRMDIGANSNIATLYITPAGAAWTNSGAKGCNFSVTYQTA